jgi:hypothetical protein
LFYILGSIFYEKEYHELIKYDEYKHLPKEGIHDILYTFSPQKLYRLKSNNGFKFVFDHFLENHKDSMLKSYVTEEHKKDIEEGFTYLKRFLD